jgi:choline dehydrogenase-like flavoprotein
MLTDLHRDTLPARLEADVCIIGAGAAGMALAIALARKGAQVVLLESGGHPSDTRIQEFNQGEVVGLPHEGTYGGRARAFGGTTTIWSGQILPLLPVDFEERSWMPWSGWPIAYPDLIPYYRSAIDFVGLGRSILSDADVWRSIGLGVPTLGPDIEPYISRWCPEPNFGRLHGQEVRRLQSLTCVLHATYVGFDARGDRLTAAWARGLGGQSVAVQSRAYVLCVGGIETARLLLHPLINRRPAPWSDSELIGCCFQDHPGIPVADVVPRDKRVVHHLFDNIYRYGFKYQPRFRLTAAAQERSRLPGIGGALLFESAKTPALCRARFAGKALVRGRVNTQVLTATAIGTPLLAQQAWQTLVRRRGFNPDDLGVRLGVQLEQAPRPDSQVSLSDQIDALGLRRARVDWRMGEFEVKSIARFAEITKAAFEQIGLADVRIDTDVETRSPSILARMHDQAHHMGTARMASTPDRGVVTSDLRLFGTDNAYVCSSAVFPTSGYSNPTHTIIALALRLADHMAGALAHG